MLIIAHPRDNVFLSNPLVQQAQALPKFRHTHDLLAELFDDPEVQLAMQHDLAPAESQAEWNGRPSLPLVVSGCLAVVRRLMGWSYRVLAEEVDGSAGWRWVCQLYAQPMPDFRTIQAREALLRPETLQLIHAKVVHLSQRRGLTHGTRLRIDSTVTETNIHYPTDSRLLDDAARVVSRQLQRARALVPPQTDAERACFRDRHRQAHHLAVQIARASTKKTQTARKNRLRLYRQLVRVVERLLAQVAQVQARLARCGQWAAQRVAQTLRHYTPLVARVLRQTRQRVLEEQAVPAQEKLVSLFEPHTAIIRRGKAKPHETEFGCKVWFAEVEGGLISEYRLLQGNPPDKDHVVASVQYHRAHFGRAPREVSGDRGMYSAENERHVRALGVRRVSLPQPGHLTARRRRREQQRWFRAAQRFRAGIEGRISQVRRARRLTRCLNHGWAGLQRWIGWGVIANNIAVLVAKVT